MRIRFSRQTNQGLTLFEAIIVMGIIIILGTILLLPALSGPRHRCGYSCTNNLKQLGLAYKIWAGDNNDKFPMEISTASGGAKEWMQTADAWMTYLVMSNELSTPKILLCPQDSPRGKAATNWNDDLKNKISYFIGIDATNVSTQMILSGDGSFLLDQSSVKPGLLSVTTSTQLQWDGERHPAGARSKPTWLTKPKKTGIGYLLLTDGSVQAATDNDLNYSYLNHTGLATNRFFVP